MSVGRMRMAVGSIKGWTAEHLNKLKACIDLGIQMASIQTDLLHRPSKDFWVLARTNYKSNATTQRKMNRKAPSNAHPPSVQNNLVGKFALWYAQLPDERLADLPQWPEPTQGGRHEPA
jgi:hypothetical protein